MTREEEIVNAARKRAERHQIAEMELYGGDKCNYSYGRIYNSEISSFKTGVKWADNNPDLSSLWHDASEEPQENSKIVIVDTKGEWWNIDYASDDFDDNGLYGWNFCIAHYNLKIWAYINDLLPKGGKK